MAVCMVPMCLYACLTTLEHPPNERPSGVLSDLFLNRLRCNLVDSDGLKQCSKSVLELDLGQGSVGPAIVFNSFIL